jgi:CubicO group peptidase (beta-lactamase class C family)
MKYRVEDEGMRFDIGVLILSILGALCALGTTTLEGVSRSPAVLATDVPCVSTPEAQGMDSTVLSRTMRGIGADGKGLHSVLVVRNGCLVIEAYRPPYRRDQKHYLNSATKSILSALVGIAIHDGTVHEDDFVSAYLPDHVRADGDPRTGRIRIRHLLTMSSGISWPQSASENTSDQMGHSTDWVRFILDRPMAAEPGSVTNYSNGDSHVLSAVLERATGKTALDFARTRLFQPLGIEDVAWDADPQGRSIGSAALQMRPVDMAKVGALYMRGGEFETRPILDPEWVSKSWTGQVKMPTRGGTADYGYYWWLYPERRIFEAWGGAGQRISVLRDVGVVVVMTADIPDDIPRSPFAARLTDGVRESVKSSGRLPDNPSAVADLQRSISVAVARSAAAANERSRSPAHVSTERPTRAR